MRPSGSVGTSGPARVHLGPGHPGQVAPVQVGLAVVEVALDDVYSEAGGALSDKVILRQNRP